MITIRKQAILDLSNRLAKKRISWKQKNRYFHETNEQYFGFLISPNLRVLEIGCGIGDLLAALKPSYGVGVDFSEETLAIAKKRHADLHFVLGDVEDITVIQKLEGPFDVIILDDTIGSLEDCQKTLEQLRPLCTPETRLIISYYGRLWEPVLKLAELIGQKMPQVPQNYLSTADIGALLNLSGFEVIKREWRQLLPKWMLGVGPLLNRYLATLPGIRRLCLRNYIVARLDPKPISTSPSTTVVIPCRNERGNVEPAVQRLPRFCPDLEIIFAEGNSQDGTLEEIQRVIKAYPQYDIKVIIQDGKGKGNAVHKAFGLARGNILMILDGDLTTPPEDMPKFYQAFVNGKGEFINGSRLIYPMENQAMQFLNFIANKGFSWLFSYLLNQRFTDTLCGTKVITKHHYHQLMANRHYFGDFDPFGDFDLIFGASKLNLKVVEIPVRYQARTYGTTQISRFQHGWLLLKMVLFAYRKLKAF
jgi:ubiquinone/menaquinone biosynthesis C-methylase UbiE